MAGKKKKPTKKRRAAPEKKPVPLNELYPDVSKVRWIQNFLKKRSK